MVHQIPGSLVIKHLSAKKRPSCRRSSPTFGPWIHIHESTRMQGQTKIMKGYPISAYLDYFHRLSLQFVVSWLPWLSEWSPLLLSAQHCTAFDFVRWRVKWFASIHPDCPESIIPMIQTFTSFLIPIAFFFHLVVRARFRSPWAAFLKTALVKAKLDEVSSLMNGWYFSVIAWYQNNHAQNISRHLQQTQPYFSGWFKWYN